MSGEVSTVKPEAVRRHQDEMGCDQCGQPIYVDETVWVNIETGAAYCSPRCARRAGEVATGRYQEAKQ